MEYNVELKSGLDINNENSLTLLLKKISCNSSVLEFGPAYGRMTKFMKEELGCRVTCIELNPKTENVLKQYAEKVIIGNIEDYEWVQQIKEKKFDYIVFADVLEHLINPEKALTIASSFLVEEGKILISIPNIAHNAVITNLYFNEFDYQEVGILDETHLRFFTQNSLKKMFTKVGLYIHDQNATFYTPEMTGLITQELPKDIELENFLRKRPLGYVYQYIYVLGKTKYQEIDSLVSIDEMVKPYTFKVYFDTGSGFSENNVYTEYFSLSGEQYFQVDFECDKSIESVRIDPIDVSCVCTLNGISFVNSLGETVQIDLTQLNSNAIFSLENTYVFLSNDPQFVIKGIGPEWKKIKISFSLMDVHIEEYAFLNLVEQYISSGKNSQSCSSEKERELNDKLSECLDSLTRSEDMIKAVQNENQLRGQKVAELEGLVDYYQQQAQNLRKTLKSTEEESTQRAEEIARLSSQAESIQNEAQLRSIKIAELEGLVNYYQKQEQNLWKTLKSVEEESAQKKEEIARLGSQVESIRNEAQLRSVKIAELEGLVHYREKQEQDLWEKLQVARDEQQKTQNENQYLRKQLTDLSRQVFKKNLRIVELEDQQMKP